MTSIDRHGVLDSTTSPAWRTENERVSRLDFIQRSFLNFAFSLDKGSYRLISLGSSTITFPSAFRCLFLRMEYRVDVMMLVVLEVSIHCSILYNIQSVC